MPRFLRKVCPLASISWLAVLLLATAIPAAAAPSGQARDRDGGEGDSQISESAADELGLSAGAGVAPEDLSGRMRVFIEGSLAKYDQIKNDAAGFRKQGWYPSFFLREPERDVLLDPGTGGTQNLSVHISGARRDIEHRMIVAPLERFVLPGADRRFLAELLAALAASAPGIGRVRLIFWFSTLHADGRMAWEHRGNLALTADAARRISPQSRTPETVWPVLEENTLPAALWP